MQLTNQLALLDKFERAQYSLHEYLRSHTMWSGYRKRLFEMVDIEMLPFYKGWNAEMEQEAIAYLRRYNLPTNSVLWHKVFYAATGLHDVRYLSEPFFYDRIEPRLSPRSRINKYFDKNFYERLQLSSRPKVLARLIAGRLTFPDLSTMSVTQLLPQIENYDELVVKPALDSGCGKKIQFIEPEKLVSLIANLKRQGVNDLVIQEPIIQCTELAAFNPSSVNTVRVVTLRYGKEVKHLLSVLRMGCGPSRIDNWGQGGYSVGINNDGALMPYGFNQNYLRQELHPESGKKFAGSTVPEFSTAVALCCAKHSGIPDVDMISWDVAITHDYEPIIVELNMNLQGISLLQLSHGPLFGQLTDAILERYQPTRKKSLLSLTKKLLGDIR